jgi:hypothetical protein
MDSIIARDRQCAASSEEIDKATEKSGGNDSQANGEMVSVRKFGAEGDVIFRGQCSLLVFEFF